MAVEEAPEDPALESASAPELDWNAVYAGQLPRVYNYFRFRLGRHSDIEVYAIDTRPFPVETQSLDKIWTDPRGFDLDIDELAKAAYTLAAAAQTHDSQAIGQAANRVGAACAACHAAYREQPAQPR